MRGTRHSVRTSLVLLSCFLVYQVPLPKILASVTKLGDWATPRSLGLPVELLQAQNLRLVAPRPLLRRTCCRTRLDSRASTQLAVGNAALPRPCWAAIRRLWRLLRARRARLPSVISAVLPSLALPAPCACMALLRSTAAVALRGARAPRLRRGLPEQTSRRGAVRARSRALRRGRSGARRARARRWRVGLAVRPRGAPHARPLEARRRRRAYCGRAGSGGSGGAAAVCAAGGRAARGRQRLGPERRVRRARAAVYGRRAAARSRRAFLARPLARIPRLRPCRKSESGKSL